MKMKRRIMSLILSLALAVTFIPSVAFAVPGEGDAQGAVMAADKGISDAVSGINEELPPQDDLLQQYLQKQASRQTRDPAKAGASGKLKAPASDKLSGNEKIVYEYIYSAAREIAAGERDSAVIRIPVSSFMDGKLQFTAEELGVETLVTDWVTDDDAKAAYLQLFDFDDKAVMSAMTSAVPYELYWYDKTKGYSGDLTNEVGVIKDEDREEYRIGFVEIDDNDEPTGFAEDPAWVFELRVSAEFNPDGQTGTTVVDCEKTSAATAAANKAAQIKADCESYGDLQKLAAYKSAICDLTDYNSEAATDADMPYGNPWQLIWVFDENPDTKVVCEGYAKAFQFLCDLSTFEDESVESYIATGRMDAGEGPEAHMWNIVRMDDGRNYLVDVTNCDGEEGSEDAMLGCPDWLFLKGYYQHKAQTPQTYVYRCSKDAQYKIEYTYDEKTLNLYSDDELSLSPRDYGLKLKQTLTVKNKKIKVKAKKVRKKKQTVKPLTVTGQKTAVTYKGKAVGKKAKKALKINAKTGKITVAKKTRKGKYKMKVTVTAAGNAQYEPASKTVTVTIQVK